MLCAPHLQDGGWHNNARVVEIAGRSLLAAEKAGRWLVVGATRPFARLSCGYVGASDGWTDLAGNYQMDWTFDHADDGNVALMGEVDDPEQPFTLGLAMGNSLHSAVTTLLQSLDIPFEKQLERFVEQWTRATRHLLPLDAQAGDGGLLAATSFSLLLAHEDKTYPGALIASLSIPWGESNGDEDRGGYHLVWTRDLVNSVAGLLAAGNMETARRALVYLAASQRDDGGFAQNAWIDGDPYWTGIQLDEIAFPILLARRLAREGALGGFDPYPMVLRAAAYLVRHGPVTDQDRWEEESGYSPSTLANNIAGLISAACFARDRGDPATAAFLEDYADFLEQHVEAWTVTTQGVLLPGVTRHYIRIHPIAIGDPAPNEDPNEGLLTINNIPPGERYEFPGEGRDRCRIPRAGAVRHPPPARPDHRGLAARRGRGAEGRDAARPVLASLQPRRLRPGGGRRAVPPVGRGARVAAADRRARTLRAGGRPRSVALHPHARAVRVGHRAAARAGLGRRTTARPCGCTGAGRPGRRGR